MTAKKPDPHPHDAAELFFDVLVNGTMEAAFRYYDAAHDYARAAAARHGVTTVQINYQGRPFCLPIRGC